LTLQEIRALDAVREIIQLVCPAIPWLQFAANRKIPWKQAIGSW